MISGGNVEYTGYCGACRTDWDKGRHDSTGCYRAGVTVNSTASYDNYPDYQPEKVEKPEKSKQARMDRAPRPKVFKLTPRPLRLSRGVLPRARGNC